MKFRISLALFSLLTVAVFSLAAKPKPTDAPDVAHPPAASEDGMTVYFSPDGGAEAAIISHINAATKSIDVGCFHFTAEPLATALVAAKDRGVNVRMVIDEKASLEPKCLAGELKQHGIPVFVDSTYHTAHNKVMIFDDSTILTGSYNYTPQSAQTNAENALFITGKPILAAAYLADFRMHLSHSAPLTDTPAAAKSAKAED